MIKVDYNIIIQLCKEDKEISELIKQRDKLLDEMKGKYVVLLFNLPSKEPILFPDKFSEVLIKELNNKIVERANVLLQNYLKEK